MTPNPGLMMMRPSLGKGSVASRLSTGAAGLFLGVSLVACEGIHPPAQIELTQVEATRLPEGWRPSLVALTSTEAYAIYSRSPSLLSWWPDTTRSLRLPHRTIVGIRSADAGFLELIDGQRSELVRVDSAGKVLSATRIPVDRIWNGLWFRDHWLLVAGDSTGSAQVYQLSDEGVRLASTKEMFRASETFLGVAGGHPVVSQMHPPFNVSPVVDEQWSNTRTGWLYRRSAETAPPNGWIALRVVPVDSLGLQTLVDLRSPARRLRLVTPSGAVVRVTEVAAPIGFLGRTATGRLLALRLGKQPQLIQYAWEWRED